MHFVNAKDTCKKAVLDKKINWIQGKFIYCFASLLLDGCPGVDTLVGSTKKNALYGWSYRAKLAFACMKNSWSNSYQAVKWS